MVRERLQAWITTHKRVPGCMVFYRDGVSDSQFHSLEGDEIAKIEPVWLEFWNQAPNNGWERPSESKLKLTYLVVTKRHHTRLYPKDAKASYQSWDSATRKTVTNGNVAPGTVVDSIITDPRNPSFYLQSHHTFIGTGKCGHYHLLRNGMNLTVPDIEKLVSIFFPRFSLFELIIVFSIDVRSLSCIPKSHGLDLLLCSGLSRRCVV